MTTIPLPMLATTGRPEGSLSGWVAEVKLDGFRAQVLVDGARRIVRTRGGHDIADQLPELATLGEIGTTMVLDGELIAGAGRPADFGSLAGRIASRRRDRKPVSFVGFDLLMLDGGWLLDRPLADRRRLLEHLSGLSEGRLPIVPSTRPRTLMRFLAACDDLDLEGVVLKRGRPGTGRVARESGARRRRTSGATCISRVARNRCRREPSLASRGSAGRPHRRLRNPAPERKSPPEGGALPDSR